MTDKEMRKMSEYHSWFYMTSRCLNPNDPSYPDYGGSGITIYEEWKTDFWLFLKYMGKKPKGRYSIDRIDGTRSYEPGNVRWATQKEQVRNRKNTVKATYNGETKAVAELCENLNVDYEKARHRIKIGWSFDRAITEEVNNETRYFEYDGNNYTVKELAEKFGMLKSVLSQRINLGWDLEKCLKTPVEEKEWEITYNNKTQNMKDWAIELGIPYKALHLRLTRYGWSVNKAFTEPIENKLEFNGEFLTLKEWSNKLKIPYATLHQRINGYGWTVEKALTKPLGKQSKVYNKEDMKSESTEHYDVLNK